MNDLLSTVPQVLRARGFRLYTQKRRLVDLWLNGGAAVMGHTPSNFLRELKNTASRGLYAPYPHFTEGRFLKALSKLLPGKHFRVYAAPPPELTKLFADGTAKLWRPFHCAEPAANDMLQIPVVPGIQLWRDDLPYGLCVTAATSETLAEKLPAGDSISPVLLAVAARGIYDLIASPQRERPSLPRTFKALKESTLWERHGIYLTLKEKPSQKTWAALFTQFLEAGFLLPPVPTQPVILPGELSQGEDAKLAEILIAKTTEI